jgi:NADH-quinone oxidoreductase subunit M
MINHGISTGALFLVVGMIYERYHTRDIDKLGGLARQMPILGFFLILFVLSSIGLPGLNGFISEFTVLFAAYNSREVLGPTYGVIGATGILLGAVYMLYMAGKVLFGPLKEPTGTPDLSAGLKRDLNFREITILAPLAVMVVWLGVYPRTVTDKLDPELVPIIERMEGPLQALQQRRQSRAEALANTSFSDARVAHRFSAGEHESDVPLAPPTMMTPAARASDADLSSPGGEP